MDKGFTVRICLLYLDVVPQLVLVPNVRPLFCAFLELKHLGLLTSSKNCQGGQQYYRRSSVVDWYLSDPNFGPLL
jgi:hypothetical protein